MSLGVHYILFISLTQFKVNWMPHFSIIWVIVKKSIAFTILIVCIWVHFSKTSWNMYHLSESIVHVVILAPDLHISPSLVPLWKTTIRKFMRDSVKKICSVGLRLWLPIKNSKIFFNPTICKMFWNILLNPNLFWEIDSLFSKETIFVNLQ